MGLLIKGGEIVTASDRYVADLRVDGGTITEIGAKLEARAGEEVVDAAGKLVMPGFIDPHVHMELPFMGTVSADDFESGTASGIAGGTTCIIDFCMQGPGQSLPDAIAEWHKRSAKAVTDYTYHMAITNFGPTTAAEMREVVEKHGITSFKVFMAYKGAIMVDDGQLYQVMKEAAKLGAVVTVHAENGDAVALLQKELVAAGCMGPEYHPVSRPSAVEGEATERALMMARLHGTTAYIVHMTCKEAVHALERAKLSGQRCYGETCPQYLLLDDTVFQKPDFGGSAYVMSPPIRPGHVGHHDALWAGVSNGMLDSVGTDHCPFTHEQKKMGLGDFTKIPNGAAGIEDRLTLLYSYGVKGGHFDVQRMVELGSTAPARIFGLAKKGSIAVGMDADIVLYDPNGESTRSAKTHHSKCDRNIFEGFKTYGRVATTIVNGKIAWDGTKLMTTRGSGRFVTRKPSHFAQHAEVKV
ncbi:MAG: dihydropyrimidinase [Candidatus Eisenbacteria bacterium]|uniref:Dihydropyrimidinase n=1 Tax=Eiseniibacteriota bacterium TaxID=2212470 RepID=A0A933W943_UNCEI|nr:dihydropyrimidinase [Candidatus Eisenbacteria bacterium]